MLGSLQPVIIQEPVKIGMLKRKPIDPEKQLTT